MKEKVKKVKFILIGLLFVLIILILIKNSITPSNLGVVNGELSPLPNSPNCVSSYSLDKERYVEPIPFVGTYEESKTSLLEAMNNYGDMKLVKVEGNYVHIVFTTKSLKFNDDVELLFDINLSKIYYRSASRIGYRDGGLNKQRYEDIKKAYLDNQ